MKVGDLIKTRYATNGGFFAYSGPATFEKKVATYPANGLLLGSVSSLETTGSVFGIGGTKWVGIKLDQPVTYGGVVYSNVFIKETGVYVPTTTMAQYYVNAKVNKVNYRAAPSTVTGKILGQLSGGELAGSGDGTKSNGFYRITRPNGAVVWISANYITARAASTTGSTTPSTTTPAGGTTTTTPSGSTDTTSEKNTLPQTIEIKLENLVGEKAAPAVKWGFVALGVGLIILVVYRFAKAKGRKRK
ncbi:SH3 domain-containing protein [Fibrella forsythiae]|uniref:SH3b domain-containing protein n=1 Tax=Fibrella forsythiae TaxID=2817061 RepID=A0ABS3JMG6_9BACT|nr:SH3 domain-containing protein [Fibrella forsythiae]MBO0951201.1 hypothetical protein [Fibrella forsythiae]